MTSEKAIQEAYEKCRLTVQSNLLEMATELLEWHETSLLKEDGKIRETAHTLGKIVGTYTSPTMVVENMINREALVHLVRGK